MKARSSKMFRKKRSFFILSVFFTFIFFWGMILVWFAPESWAGVYARDQWLIHVIEQHQHGDGFFVFTNDTHPNFITETYFAVVTLNGLSTDIPNKDQLRASITSVEEAAKNSLLQNKPILGPRVMYELLMIHRLAAIPVDNKLLAGYLSQMTDLLSRQNEKQFPSSVHDWYYALQSLIVSNRITSQLRKQTEMTILTQLATKPVQLPPLIQTALLVDLSTSLHIHLNTAALQNTRFLLKQSWSAEGGFQTGQTPDILSTYFSVILAHEIDSEDLIQHDAIERWLATQRNWDGYSTNNTNFVVTAYAMVLRNFLNGESIDGAPR